MFTILQFKTLTKPTLFGSNMHPLKISRQMRSLYLHQSLNIKAWKTDQSNWSSNWSPKLNLSTLSLPLNKRGTQINPSPSLFILSLFHVFGFYIKAVGTQFWWRYLLWFILFWLENIAPCCVFLVVSIHCSSVLLCFNLENSTVQFQW